MPCEKEVRIHNLTHIPFRSWCPYCVQGKAVSGQHRANLEKTDEEITTISMDYAGMKTREPNEETFPIIVIYDRKSKACFAHVVPRKGVNEYAVKRVSQDLVKILGYKKFVFKSDQEPAIKQLKEAVIRQCKAGENQVDRIKEEESPVGESQSNGEVENEIKMIQAQFRTVRAQTENNYMEILPETHNSLPWMVRHSAEQRFRFNVGHDGRTPRQRIKGKRFTREMCLFGECVWYLKPKTKGVNKAYSRWGEGVWLGIREESGETLIGLKEGVIKVNSIRRHATEGKRWNKELFNNFQGVPWEPVPGSESSEVRSRVRLPETPNEFIEPARTREVESVPRRHWITREDVREFGMTPGCPGCRNANAGGRAVKHTETCRERMRRELEQREDPRLHREAERVLRRHEREAEVIEPEIVEQMEDLPEEVNEEMEEAQEEDAEMEDGNELFNVMYEISADKGIEQQSNERGRTRKWDDDIKKMNEALMKGNLTGIHEIYSPKRVNAMAELMGLIPGMSLDLTNNDIDAKPWDFNIEEKRGRAERLVREKKALLLIGSPMCSAFSQIQNLNFARMTPAEVDQVVKYGTKHLEF